MFSGIIGEVIPKLKYLGVTKVVKVLNDTSSMPVRREPMSLRHSDLMD